MITLLPDQDEYLPDLPDDYKDLPGSIFTQDSNWCLSADKVSCFNVNNLLVLNSWRTSEVKKWQRKRI